ncbi:hypothetical protein ABHI18_012676 [Aspergillus niger]
MSYDGRRSMENRRKVKIPTPSTFGGLHHLREARSFTLFMLGKQKRFGIRHSKHFHSLKHPALRRGLLREIQAMIVPCSKSRSECPLDPSVWFVDRHGIIKVDLGGDNATLESLQQYGNVVESVGMGSFGTILLLRAGNRKDLTVNEFFALKLFRRQKRESGFQYHYRVTSQYTIVESLEHRNIIRVFQQGPIGHYSLCETMEFCFGGDLHSLIVDAQKLEEIEANCFFKQLIRGVVYMHDMRIAHRDLKPENLLLTTRGCLKIADFDTAERCHYTREGHMGLTSKRCGSTQYISPEQYSHKVFDARATDIWACGVTYVAMKAGSVPWEIASPEDDGFRKYVQCYGSSPSCTIERLGSVSTLYLAMEQPQSRFSTLILLYSFVKLRYTRCWIQFQDAAPQPSTLCSLLGYRKLVYAKLENMEFREREEIALNIDISISLNF